jgi:hypothetical protein
MKKVVAVGKEYSIPKRWIKSCRKRLLSRLAMFRKHCYCPYGDGQLKLNDCWLKQLKSEANVLFIAAGVFYYFEAKQIKDFFTNWPVYFPAVKWFLTRLRL